METDKELVKNLIMEDEECIIQESKLFDQMSVMLNPIVVERIFKYISFRDLMRVSRVCTVWFKLAKIEKNRRTKIAKIFIVSENTKRMLESRSESLYQPIEIETDMRMELEKLPCVPSFCIVFMSKWLYKRYDEYFPSFMPDEPARKKLKAENTSRKFFLNDVIKTALRKYLPENCEISLNVTYGVIGCKGDIPYTPLEIEDGTALSACFYPNMPGMQVKLYPIEQKQGFAKKFITGKEPAKALLFFVTDKGCGYVNKILKNNLWEKDFKVALGGAVVEQSDSIMGSIIAFSGPNVEAASILIGPEDEEKEIRSKLEILKDTGLQNNDCFAYMFTCIARGASMHAKPHFESSLFNEYFPNIPIIGLFGTGEYGVNFLPNVKWETTELEHGAFIYTEKNYRYGYCTVFVVIALKKDN
ncbi:DNA-(apurinic or apyrimidinic site) lyase [Caerostris darwini]|uniref:DNA-(Apurinic or apyrimidinic site) lyase n=1 Tax=Caerostris darwini TaxID=1538125 RepID=A0AAV4TJR4_9ARAC|nr:DNA-(apurinic or apyrimidinic site) lyase [Caerostris darwini]